MDDRTFDRESALEWIRTIECEAACVRERDIYPRLRAWAARDLPARILDLGCGQGACSAALDLGGCTYIGVEPSPHLLERARELYPGKSFVQGNAYALPFENGAFDAVFSVAVWHLLEKPETASRELARVLKPEGRFLMITADPGQRQSWESGNSRDVLYLHSRDLLLGSLAEAGLKAQVTETIRHFIAIEGRA